MKFIEAVFILPIQNRQQRAGNARGQAGHIDSTVQFIPAQVAQSGFQVVTEHNWAIECLA